MRSHLHNRLSEMSVCSRILEHGMIIRCAIRLVYKLVQRLRASIS